MKNGDTPLLQILNSASAMFELWNNLVTFNQLMDCVLHGLCWSRCQILLDEIISWVGDLYFSSSALVRFAVGVHEVPAHLCAFAVTYKPCSMQRGSEVWPLVDYKYKDLPDCWKSIKQYVWFVTYYRWFIQDKTCFITMVQDGDMCAIMPKITNSIYSI